MVPVSRRMALIAITINPPQLSFLLNRRVTGTGAANFSYRLLSCWIYGVGTLIKTPIYPVG